MEEYTEKNIKDLENQLLSKIGNFSTRKKDAVQYEKVHRYIYLVRLLYELKARLHQDGLVVTVHNGQQRFQKANSLIKEINTTSNQLLTLRLKIHQLRRNHHRMEVIYCDFTSSD